MVAKLHVLPSSTDKSISNAEYCCRCYNNCHEKYIHISLAQHKNIWLWQKIKRCEQCREY